MAVTTDSLVELLLLEWCLPHPRLTGFNSDCQYFLIVWKVSHFSRFTSLPHFHPWELEGLEILVRNETTWRLLLLHLLWRDNWATLLLQAQTFGDQGVEYNIQY